MIYKILVVTDRRRECTNLNNLLCPNNSIVISRWKTTGSEPNSIICSEDVIRSFQPKHTCIMFKGPNWNKLMSTRQGSPEALGTDENRCLLNLGTQASQGNYTYIFLDWLGKERSCHWGLEICSDHFKVSGEP